MAYGTNAPFGLQPRMSMTGATWSGQTNDYFIASGYATALFQGDPVVGLADGTIGIGVTGTGITGVFQGCKYTDPNGNIIFGAYWPASTVTQGALPATAAVCDDPNILYDIQVSNSANVAGPTIALGSLNANADFAVGGGGGNLGPRNNPAGGSTFTGQSAYYLNFSTIDTTATRSLKIMRFTPVPGNVASVPFNNVLVQINNDISKGGTGTAGV